MIAIVVAFFIAGHPAFVVRSVETFDTVADCLDTLPSERAGFEAAALSLSARAGQPVRFEAACLDLAEGVPT